MPSRGGEKENHEEESNALSHPLIPELDDSDDAKASRRKKKSAKKRSASEIVFDAPVDDGKPANEDVIDEDLNEPTMGERVATLIARGSVVQRRNQVENVTLESNPPLADSIYVILRQALRSDDRNLLLDCLYTQDEKVISNSVLLLDSLDVLNLLDKLMAIIHSRGAILACTIPWLKALLLQHASGVMSQESSYRALSSLNQLIKSRVGTFEQTLRLSSCLDLLYPSVDEEIHEETEVITPAIYDDGSEDGDDSDDSVQLKDHESN